MQQTAPRATCNETLTINNPPVGTYRIGVFNSGTGSLTG